MKRNYIIPMLSLQLFAEGGTGGTAGAAGDGGTAQGTGVTAAAAVPQKKAESLYNVKYGIQPEEAPVAEVPKTTEETPPDLNAEFESLIKGKFKVQYDSRMQDTIQKRLKGQKETVDKYTALEPMLEILAKKYGVDVNDAAALSKAITEDDSYYEAESMETGIPVKQIKEMRKYQRENAQLRQQIQDQQNRENADKLYTNWMNQAEDVRKVYPSFDMRAEMSNPKFVDLLRSNIDVRTAYEVLHRDEIIPAAMQFTAKTVESKIAKSIASGGSRPAENGMNSGSAAVVKSDVTQLSKKDIAEIARRVARGERITFG